MRRHAVVLTWLALAGAACSETRAGNACSACAGAPARDAGGEDDAGPNAVDAGQHASEAGHAGGVGGIGRAGSAAGSGGEPTEHSGGGGAGAATTGIVFSPYKDTSISLNWNTNLISTAVSGTATEFTADAGSGLKTITLAFATGECGSESWGGVTGAALATANKDALDRAGIRYIISTGGASGTFTCASDAGMEAFIARWAGPGLIGVDFDIEGGQTQAIIDDLIARVAAAHVAHPTLRFSLTLATLASSEAGQESARSRGAQVEDNFNTYGTNTLMAVKNKLGFSGESRTWPDYLTVNLMTMDYGSATPSSCIVSGGSCQMGQSALQAAYNLHDHWGVPWSAIELTPMIGGNDATSETFTLDDVDLITAFARSMSLSGLHYWSYDRDRDCMPGSASATCNTYGSAGTRGFLTGFLRALAK